MEKRETRVQIPNDVRFEDLKMARDPKTGEVAFDWAPIERICAASGIDVAVFKEGPEDNVSALIVEWYRAHRADGGAIDAVQEQLLAEIEVEDVSVLQANPGASGVH